MRKSSHELVIVESMTPASANPHARATRMNYRLEGLTVGLISLSEEATSLFSCGLGNGSRTRGEHWQVAHWVQHAEHVCKAIKILPSATLSRGSTQVRPAYAEKLTENFLISSPRVPNRVSVAAYTCKRAQQISDESHDEGPKAAVTLR